MSSEPRYEETFIVEGDDFTQAGTVSIEIRKVLDGFRFDPELVRRVAIVAYEAEINIVLYAERGEMRLQIFPEKITLEIEDTGQGIENIEMALQNGYSTATSEMRELGFGAGMGLPNIKRNSDDFSISSVIGEGTRISVGFLTKEDGAS